MIFIARKPPKWMAAALLLALATFWFTVRGIHGIHFLAFGDESGHLLGARALRAGDRLYRDFIDAHGPLSFMAAQVFGEVFGYKEPLNARWGIVVLTSFTAITVYRSAAFQQTATRLWGTAIFLGLISAPWLVQSLDMVNYHILGGLLNTIVLSGLGVPDSKNTGSALRLLLGPALRGSILARTYGASPGCQHRLRSVARLKSRQSQTGSGKRGHRLCCRLSGNTPMAVVLRGYYWISRLPHHQQPGELRPI